jgi:hypothetical protein
LVSVLDQYSVTELLALVALAGGLAYGVLRIVYAQFFAEFSLQPEDVGLGQNEIIRQSLAGPTMLAIVVAVMVVLVVLGTALGFSVIIKARKEWGELRKWIRDRGLPGDESETGQPVPPVVRALAPPPARANEGKQSTGKRQWPLTAEPGASGLRLHATWLSHRCHESVNRTLVSARRRWWLIVIVAVGIVFAGLSELADRVANNALDNGETIHVLDQELGPLRLPLLDVQAVAATFKSTDEDNAPLPPELNSSCLLYLGRTDQAFAVYDVAEHVTYRFPGDHIMVELATENRSAAEPLHRLIEPSAQSGLDAHCRLSSVSRNAGTVPNRRGRDTTSTNCPVGTLLPPSCAAQLARWRVPPPITGSAGAPLPPESTSAVD